MLQRPPHFTAFIFWTLVEGVVKVLMIHNITLKQTKFPGGSCKHPDKTPLQTGLRECREEVFENEVADTARMEETEPKLGAQVCKGPLHTQYFYFLRWDEKFGTIRTLNKIEKDERTHDERNRPIIDETVAPPHWVDLKDALFEVFPPHREALRTAIEAMCCEPEILEYLEKHSSQALPTPK